MSCDASARSNRPVASSGVPPDTDTNACASDGDTQSGRDAYASARSDCYTDACARSDGYTYASGDSDTDGYTDACDRSDGYTDACTDCYTDACARSDGYTYASGDSDTDGYTDACARSDGYAYACTDSDTDSDTDACARSDGYTHASGYSDGYAYACTDSDTDASADCDGYACTPGSGGCIPWNGRQFRDSLQIRHLNHWSHFDCWKPGSEPDRQHRHHRVRTHHGYFRYFLDILLGDRQRIRR